MTDKMTEEEFINKIAWEGGIIGALTYGLRASDLADQDSDLAKAWRHLENGWVKLVPRIDKVEELIPDEAW
jgi:hypothetical protein